MYCLSPFCLQPVGEVEQSSAEELWTRSIIFYPLQNSQNSASLWFVTTLKTFEHHINQILIFGLPGLSLPRWLMTEKFSESSKRQILPSFNSLLWKTFHYTVPTLSTQDIFEKIQTQIFGRKSTWNKFFSLTQNIFFCQCSSELSWRATTRWQLWSSYTLRVLVASVRMFCSVSWRRENVAFCFEKEAGIQLLPSMKLLFIYIRVHVVAKNIQRHVTHSVRPTGCAAEIFHVSITSLVVYCDTPEFLNMTCTWSGKKEVQCFPISMNQIQFVYLFVSSCIYLLDLCDVCTERTFL